jgi:Flp pilus assembly protein CpaB
MKLRPKRAQLDAEMDYRDPHARRRKVMMIVGVFMAIAAGLTAYFGSSGAAQAKPIATRTVIVAAIQIPARTVLTTKHLAQRAVPDDPYLKAAIVDPALLVGQVTSVSIYQNQPFLPSLMTTSAADARFTILGPDETISPESPTWRAVSVTVPKERGVGGRIDVGQHIDLIATMQVNVMARNPDGTLTGAPSSQGYYSDKSTKITWENVEVLAHDGEGDLYVLKVDLHQAEEIAQAQDASSDGFTIALRPDEDNRQLDRSGYGETVNRLIEQYRFPLPQIIPLDGYPQPSPGTAP